jgi:hypothetical protein
MTKATAGTTPRLCCCIAVTTRLLPLFSHARFSNVFAAAASSAADASRSPQDKRLRKIAKKRAKKRAKKLQRKRCAASVTDSNKQKNESCDDASVLMMKQQQQIQEIQSSKQQHIQEIQSSKEQQQQQQQQEQQRAPRPTVKKFGSWFPSATTVKGCGIVKGSGIATASVCICLFYQCVRLPLPHDSAARTA